MNNALNIKFTVINPLSHDVPASGVRTAPTYKPKTTPDKAKLNEMGSAKRHV